MARFPFFGSAGAQAVENLGARAGVQTVEDLLGQVTRLKEAGIEGGDIAKILPLLGIGGAGAAAAGAASAAASSGPGVLSTILTGLGSEYVGSKLFGPQEPSYAQAPTTPSGRGFLTTTQEALAAEQYAREQELNIRRGLVNAIRGAFGQAPLESFDAGAFIEESSARKARELSGATAREIQKLQAAGGIQIQLENIIRQAEIEKQRIAAQAEVAAQREKSLGDIQRQRVESSYGAASNLLNQTIKDVVARERYENNTTLAELAKAI